MFQSETGMSTLLQAVTLLREKQYDQSAVLFREATASFEEAERTLFWFGGPVLDMTRFVPGLSQASSGKHAILAGKYFGEAGESLSVLVKNAALSKEAYAQGEKVSLLSFLVQVKEPLTQARESLFRAEKELALVRIDDLPAEKKEKFLLVRTSLPSVLALLSGFEKNEVLIEELLGGNGPRTYLFLLQNNHEMRATGGIYWDICTYRYKRRYHSSFFCGWNLQSRWTVKRKYYSAKTYTKNKCRMEFSR